MRSWKLATGGLLLSGLALVVLGNGFTGAAPPGGKDKASTRKAKQAPAGDAAAGRAEPGSKRPGVQTRPAATDPSDAAKAALLLRKQGKIISQSGDLKLKVESNFFTEFPGFNLDSLSGPQRDHLLKRANSIYCTCGCRGDTVARCVVLDPTCQTARKMFQKMLDDISAGEGPAVKKDKPASK